MQWQHQAAGADKDNQQPAEPALDAATGMHQYDDDDDINDRLRYRLNAERQPAIVEGHDRDNGKDQVAGCRRRKQGRILFAKDARLSAGEEIIVSGTDGFEGADTVLLTN